MFFIIFILGLDQTIENNHKNDLKVFQKEFIKKETELSVYISKLKTQKSYNYLNIKSDFNVHIYRNDSLINWNTNQLPITRFTDIHFPSNGIIKLQNGWYYTRYFKKGAYKIATSFLIKNAFKFENEFLKNEFAQYLQLPFNSAIVLEKEQGYPIYTSNKSFAFSLLPSDKTSISEIQSELLTLCFTLFLFFFLYGLYSITIKHRPIINIGLGSSLILTQVLLIYSNSYSFLNQLTLFNPEIYASSNLFPNLFLFIINTIIIFYAILFLNSAIRKITERSKINSLLIYLSTLFYAFAIAYLYQTLIKDSSIPLEIEKLFKLNYNSFWATFSMGLLFYSYYIIVKTVLQFLAKSPWKKNELFVIWLTSGTLYFFLDLLFGTKFIFSSLLPLLINGILLFNLLRSKGEVTFNYGIVLLALFAAYISITFQEFQEEKEKQSRELYAQQLATDQDISTEVEFSQLGKSLMKDLYFQKVIERNRPINKTEFKDYMERKFFNNFWERYEIDYQLFNSELNPILTQKGTPITPVKELENILQKHSKNSEIDSNLFYIKDYTSQLSYIGKNIIYSEDSTHSLLLYTTFKTKRIPEKIGFPRLLLSNQSNIFEAIEDYSIAKYYNSKLVSQNGKYSYPTEEYGLIEKLKKTKGYYSSDAYNHYLYRKNSRDLIVLTKKSAPDYQLFTSTSYLFCFFGLFLLLPIIISFFKNFDKVRLTLALKIQVILISIVMIALLFFGIASGKFVSNQYEEYSNLLVKEKINSVLIEVKNKLGEKNKLSIEKDGEYINSILEKFATVFVTDINLYDKKGYILGTSRPKVFNSGIISDQINPEAFNILSKEKKSEFIHQESIGKLQFLSAYVPLYNNEGNLMAYINLQHFGQQQGFENQIESFLVAIINVFVLLLAFSIILSVFVSSWVTAPLKIIQQSFAKVQLGKYNKPIDYQSKDEIGALITEYNKKLEELAFTAQQLAKSERESAWREMAKQVAHEIKNPLTPMKLSLQHFQRIFDPKDELAKQKLEKVTRSIIEQIDALTLIANEFSNFAKMPKENKEYFDILPLLEDVIALFSQEKNYEIKLNSNRDKVELFADKDLMLRVFNNLIKNAIQALPEDKMGLVEINITDVTDCVRFEIKDNGKGIEESLQNKIFTPNFTTKSTGTGLGLAMVKQIIELHQGTISFKTELYLGTCFSISLPKSEN